MLDTSYASGIEVTPVLEVGVDVYWKHLLAGVFAQYVNVKFKDDFDNEVKVSGAILGARAGIAF
ncbi:hypothetical protein RsTz2092_00560 [Deferribacterales bacterium RsTz2092]